MWRIIEEFPNYIINEYGTIYKVYGKNNLRIMKPKLDKDGYLTDWQYKHAKYELVDLKNGNVWRAPYNYKQFMIEVMNDNPKCFK